MNLLKSAKFWMVTIGILLIVAAGVILLVIFAPKTEQQVPQQQAPVTDPFGSLGSGGVSSGNTLPLTLSDGSEVLVPDFTATEQPVWVSRYEYQVTGSPMEEFLVTYLQPDQDNPQGEFLVTLLNEPLGATRLAAEAAIKTSLNISDTQLCGLDAMVSAGPGVNELYAPDQNLGFSSCAGATALP